MASSNANVRSKEPIDPDSNGQEPARDVGGDNGTGDAGQAPSRPPSSRFLAALKAKLALDPAILIPMFKGSLPPVISIAMLQAPAVAQYFLTLGYLMPIISVFGLAFLPRGKFLQILLLNLFAICFGSAISLLALWSSIKARENTTPPGQSLVDPATGTVRYNSSQSAVLGVWLFANIWFVNVLRAMFPAFTIPVILYCILVNVASTFGTRMPTTAVAEHFVKELITVMLSALGLAAAVNLLLVPVSSRMVLGKEFAGSIALLKKAMGLQKKYLVGLEELDMFAVITHQATVDARAAERRKRKSRKAKDRGDHDPDDPQPSLTKEAAIARELTAAIAQVREMTGKIQADIAFAKRDVAWGKLDAKDLGEIAKLLRNATIPVVGISSIMDIFERVAERRGWNVGADEAPEIVAQKEKEKRVWNEVMKRMHVPFEILTEAVDQGLEHAALRLEIVPRPKQPNGANQKGSRDADVEAKGDSVRPGDDGFSTVIAQKLARFDATKGEALRTWIAERGQVRGGDDGLSPAEARERDQAQLYCLLYMDRLMRASGDAMLDLVAFADGKVSDGTMSRNRLIFPTQRRLRKWLLSVFRKEDSSGEQSPDLLETGENVVYVGDGYNKKKDPEHLPPTSGWQRAGNVLRKVSAFFASEECAFGFRVAAATMTVGIAAFLENTQAFFVAQRLVWALIMVAIGMTMTSGQSIFGFVCRVGGTVIAMIFSYIIWYIVDEKTPGVIVFLWLFIFVEHYFLFKFPRFTIVVTITIVTQCLIIGYELQVRAIGMQAAASSGQPFFPTYKLAPYRLAAVAGGCFVAFIFTVFPSPLTDRTWLRRDLSAALYLLANYYGVITSTVKSQIDGTAGDPDTAGTPAHELQKIRRKIFGKMMLLLPSMASHAQWQKFEPTIGGRFPREAYEDIITRTSRVMSYLTFMSYTVNHPPAAHLDALRGRRRGQSQSPSPPLTQPLPQQQPATPSSSSASPPLAPDEPTPAPGFTPSPDSDRDTDRPDRDWLDALALVLRDVSPSHHSIVSTLMLLSNSLFSGHSMPPFLPLPRPYEMTRALLRLDRRYAPATDLLPDEGEEEEGEDEGEGEGVGREDGEGDVPEEEGEAEAEQEEEEEEEETDESEEDVDLSPLMLIDSRTGHAVYDPPPSSLAQRLSRSSGPPSAGTKKPPPLRQQKPPNPLRRRKTKTKSRQQNKKHRQRKKRVHVLDPRNAEQPGYAEFAVLEICSTLVCDDLEGLIRAVSGLVGVVDFSYRVDTDRDSRNRSGGSSSSDGGFGGGGGGRGRAWEGKPKVD